MRALEFPEPPLSDGVVALRAMPQNTASLAVAARAGFERIEAPLVQRPECAHLPDVFFARMRG